MKEEKDKLGKKINEFIQYIEKYWEDGKNQ